MLCERTGFAGRQANCPSLALLHPKALTKPELIKQYLFNTGVISDWKVGSPTLYRGQGEGQPFEDKGRILEIEQGKLLVSAHWFPLSGVPDLPENYPTVNFRLRESAGGTEVTISQDHNASLEEKEPSEPNWKTVLEEVKKPLEG